MKNLAVTMAKQMNDELTPEVPQAQVDAKGKTVASQ
jgi:hypothetical protein